MCLYTKEVTKSQLRGKTPMDYFVRIAKRDIICYKLFIKEDSLTTPYKRFRWPEGNPVVSSYLNPIIKVILIEDFVGQKEKLYHLPL